MLRLAFDFIITWRETRTRPNAYPVLHSWDSSVMLHIHGVEMSFLLGK